MFSVALGAILWASVTGARGDLALLDSLSRSAFRYFWEQSNPTTGFTKDRARNSEQGDLYDIASVAATGFALAAYPIGVERTWVSREAALERTLRTLKALRDVAPREHGWFYHWFHWQTGERIWQCEVSSIDSAILFAGMIVAERYFADENVTRLVGAILDDVDWMWMLTDGGDRPQSLTFSHGWTPEMGFLSVRWGSYCEHMILYILGLGSDDRVPAGVWEAWVRPVVTIEGYDMLAGGPLFMHQLSHVFVDFRDRRDRLGYDYWVSSRNATLANRQYCHTNPKGFHGYDEDVWGLSASDHPEGYTAHGLPPWGDDNGTIAPSSAVASVFLCPEESMAAARAIAERYPSILGRYGFSIAFNPTREWVSPDVVGIDLGMMLLGIESYRTGLPQRLFMSHPVGQLGMQRAGLRVTTEGPASLRRLWLAPSAPAGRTSPALRRLQPRTAFGGW
ncbi:MAG: hypothetical protein AMXMBFR61_00670 [Fimbriimonadales bacterium]